MAGEQISIHRPSSRSLTVRALRPALLLALLAVAQPLGAALPVGAKAPDFRTSGALAGKPFSLHLKDQLRRGPLVLYFYAKAFADAMPEFRKAGARVIGMSADDLETLKRFSTEACRSAFPVAIASPDTIKAYDVVLKQKPELTDRTSYVIDQRGRIVMVHSDLDWKDHVAKTLAAVRALKR
jgi:peroxiredoxin